MGRKRVHLIIPSELLSELSDELLVHDFYYSTGGVVEHEIVICTCIKALIETRNKSEAHLNAYLTLTESVPLGFRDKLKAALGMFMNTLAFDDLERAVKGTFGNGVHYNTLVRGTRLTVVGSIEDDL